MKHTSFLNGWTMIRPMTFAPLAAAGLLLLAGAPSYAGHHASSGKTAKTTTTQAIPKVTLPYSFICPHCHLKITIKTAADWNKSCQTCACGKTNLGCYNDIKK